MGWAGLGIRGYDLALGIRLDMGWTWFGMSIVYTNLENPGISILIFLGGPWKSLIYILNCPEKWGKLVKTGPQDCPNQKKNSVHIRHNPVFLKLVQRTLLKKPCLGVFCKNPWYVFPDYSWINPVIYKPTYRWYIYRQQLRACQMMMHESLAQCPIVYNTQ